MAEKKGFVRKHVFINRSLQGHYMLTFLIPMVVMLLFWIGSLYVGADNIATTTLALIKKDVDNKITEQLQDQENPSPEQYQKLLDDIGSYLRRFSDTKTYRTEVMSTLLWVFGVGIFIVIIQIVLLTVFFSHKIAGPLYRFEKACHALIAGDYTEAIKLRKGDEMQNLAGLMNELTAETRRRMLALRDENDQQARRKIASEIKLDVESRGQ